MKEQEQIDYNRIATAIAYIRSHFREQPDLDAVAREVHLSPAHFQRMFTEWAGTSPKKFLRYTSIEYAKSLLRQELPLSLADVTYESGLSSTSRLHDLFVTIEGMTPAEYRDGGRLLRICYRYAPSPFGVLLIAATSKGICYMAFEEEPGSALQDLAALFPQAALLEEADAHQEAALQLFRKDGAGLAGIKLHLKGSGFQLKVWDSLLRIPSGTLSTYGKIAAGIGSPHASRAVGTAIGSNPVAFLIPCHRVIKAGGESGGYRWGPTRKAAIIAWEGARLHHGE